MAKLYFNYGAMSSGKSIEVIETAYKYNSKGNKALIVKPAIDTKGNKKITSRIGMEKEADVLLKPDDSIFNYSDDIKNCVCIIIDEAQFLSEKQVMELAVITKYTNIPVICYGLKVDFQGKMFPGSKKLLELADSVQELVAVCDCGKKARFNARRINGEYVLEGEQVFIGADEAYEPMCESCYFEKVLLKHSPDFQNIVKQNKQLIKKIQNQEFF